MPSKTSSRPTTQRSSTSHATQSRPKLSSSSSSSAIPRAPSSVGANMPPSLGIARVPATPAEGARLAAMRSPLIKSELVAPKTPSPNYFGLAVESSHDPRSAVGPEANWSPPTSSIRSFNPATPQHMPVDANPAFEAFKRQAEINQGFALGHGNLSHFASTPAPRMEKRTPRPEIGVVSPRTQSRDKSLNRMDVDDTDSAYVSSDSKHQSQKSMNAPSFFDIPRQDSPADISSSAKPPQQLHMQLPSKVQRNAISRLDDRHPRLSLPQNKADPPSPGKRIHRAETLPNDLEDGPVFISAAQLRRIMDESSPSQYLLLDLRVAPQYSQYRIKDALNLCIPTTLLKRPSFNVEKLQETFKNEDEKVRFSKWKSCAYIVVYDARSSAKKDALSAMNTLKKFSNEGWQGQSYILRGGIEDLRDTNADLIDRRSTLEMYSGDEALPVAGGCVMPETQCNGANPFFSNIRQNMDLIGGVGQMDLKMPEDPQRNLNDGLPAWLKTASATSDHGKVVSDKFLHIEQDELARMQKALSSRVSYGTPLASGERNVQIAGFEKGGKNRYNNIWPFEHSRVHLQRKGGADCDYVNASHVKASWSNKRYIASQGPLPATYEDFWSVIWDQDVRVIVMLTAETEGGQLKCHPYWSGREFGQIKLKALSEKRVSLEPHNHRHSTTRQATDPARRRANTTSDPTPPKPVAEAKEPPYVVVRKFTLSHAAEPFKPMREITQLHYSSWPDFGAPAQPSHLLSLVELSNAMSRAALSPSSAGNTRTEDPETSDNARPMLVHCSAGCGRTGTFCTVDTVIDMLKRQRKEISSGVTPMEMDDSQDASYWSKGKPRKGRDDDDSNWIFNDSIDLVERTVEDFRMQRISMVQSLVQYVLCYETVLEWVSQQRSGQGSSASSLKSRERSGSEPRS